MAGKYDVKVLTYSWLTEAIIFNATVACDATPEPHIYVDIIVYVDLKCNVFSLYPSSSGLTGYLHATPGYQLDSSLACVVSLQFIPRL